MHTYPGERTASHTFPIQRGANVSRSRFPLAWGYVHLLNNQQISISKLKCVASITIPSIIIHQSNHQIKLYIHTLKRARFQRVLDACIQGVPAANPPHLKPLENKVDFHECTSILNITLLNNNMHKQFNSSNNHQSNQSTN